MSTKVGLFLAAALPPALISGNPGRRRSCRKEKEKRCQSYDSLRLPMLTHGQLTLDSRGSVNTLQTSLCLTTSHGSLPSQSFTRETGLEARSLANSAGGSAARGRENGNAGAAPPLVILRAEKLAAQLRYPFLNPGLRTDRCPSN